MSRKLYSPKIWIECEVRDKNGKIITKRKFRGMSWVGRIIEFLALYIGSWLSTSSNYFGATTKSEIKDTTGTARSIILGTLTSTYLGGQAPVGDLSAGIIVGSSDTPVTIDQYDLLQRITHGTGSGQLTYGANSAEPIVRGANTYLFRISRTFTNDSPSDVVVKEIGLFLKVGMGVSPYYYSFMLARDVLSTPITVPVGATLTVRYIISHTV